MSTPGAMRAMVALLAVVAASACFAERHRFDAPRLKLALDRTLLGPGEDITGTATAIDGSGITVLGVWIIHRPDSVRYRLIDFVRTDSVEFDFRGALGGSLPGDTIIIRAFAQDTDLFSVTVEDTAIVRQAR